MSSSKTLSKTSNSTGSVTKKVYWKVPIPNFSESFFAQHATKKLIKSETFSISSGSEMITHWFLDLCPNCNCEETKSVSLYLNCKNQGKNAFDFKAKFKFGVQKDNGEDCFTSTAELIRSKEELKEGGYGYHKFLSHEELFDEKNGYIVGGKLVVFVELTVEAEIPKPTPKIACCFCSEFKVFFENEVFCDFQLKTSDDEVLKANKTILAARSPMFFNVITRDREVAEQSSAQVPFNSKVMTEVLRYIYCNEVERLSELAPELFLAAEMYQLEELKEICLQEISSSLQVGNAVKFLTIANLVNDAGELFEKCLDLIANNFCEVRKDPSWKDLSKMLLSQIIGRLCERLGERFNTEYLNIDSSKDL